MDRKIILEQDVIEYNLKDGAVERKESKIHILSEISLKLIVNGEEFVSLLCLNQYPEDLAVGFLFNEGIIDSYGQIKRVQYNERMFAVIIDLLDDVQLNTSDSIRSITSACGKGLTYINPMKTDLFQNINSDLKLSVEKIWEDMKEFNNSSDIYRNIGGVHSVMLVAPDKKILNEDIGRHNCIDKISGIMLKEGLIDQVADSYMVSSGRISSEIMTKLIRLKLPVFISRSAPTASAVRLAEKYNITIVGYVRGSKATVYTCPERIIQ